MANTPVSRDPVDVLRTKFWYEGLCIRLGVTTAYAVERRIEPDAFKRNDDNISIHRNKWWRYRCGLHTPNASTCAQADRIATGSSADLNHVLWRALRHESPVPKAGDLLRQLAPELQIIIFERNDYFRIDGGDRFLGMLEHRASMDVLACLTILLRLNYEDGRHERVWDFAQRIFRMLLILEKIFDERQIAQELFDVYRERIFSLVRWEGKRFLVDEYNFSENAGILYHFAQNTSHTKGRRLDWRERIKFMRRILDGDFGFDLKFLLCPPIGPDLDLGPPPQEKISRWQQDLRVRDWSLENVLSGGTKRFPPTEIWKD
jgi:hypothetical protein